MGRAAARNEFQNNKKPPRKKTYNKLSCVVTESGTDDERDTAMYVKQDGMVQGHEFLSRLTPFAVKRDESKLF